MAANPVPRRPALDLLQETLLGEAITTAEAAVVVSADDLRYVAVNDAACALLGYSRAELLGLEVSDIVVRDADRLLSDIQDVMDGATRHGTTAVRRKDGRELDVRFVSFPGTIGGLPQVVTVAWRIDPRRMRRGRSR